MVVFRMKDYDNHTAFYFLLVLESFGSLLPDIEDVLVPHEVSP
jgi:hypothetical protein